MNCPKCKEKGLTVKMVKTPGILHGREHWTCKTEFGGCGWSGWFTADGKHTTPPAKESNPK